MRRPVALYNLAIATELTGMFGGIYFQFDGNDQSLVRQLDQQIDCLILATNNRPI